MPGYGVVKFSVRQGGTLVIGQLLGEAGEELGIRAETLVRPSETIEMAKARIRERLRSKYRKEREPVSDPGEKFYTRAWMELQRQWPDEDELMRRLNIERWHMSARRSTGT